MKKKAECLARISSILLLTATLSYATEQQIIFNAESIKYKSGTGSDKCQERCSKRSGPDAKSLLAEGWKIVSSSPKEMIGEEYWYVPCSTCEPHGCTCIGTEYVLQKEEPAPVTKVEQSSKELELLKKENDLLKQEITLLKYENENLKLKSKRKK